ncbi:hypothetical protein LIER_29757 [Lithospermum erythrorhizon]|uniref:Uncharacterized protein n=1 Tax=Lithospermum erythrorhizon TaxID=34254 RepID=A0AAV3RR62_LITER
MEYVHKEAQSVNSRFNRGRSESLDGPPNIIGRINVILGGRSGGGYSGSARLADAKRDIFAVITGAHPEFLDLSFSRKDFQGIECSPRVPEESPKKEKPHEDVRSIPFDEKYLTKVFKIGITLGAKHEEILIRVLQEYRHILV